jgi:hypothetical protein
MLLVCKAPHVTIVARVTYEFSMGLIWIKPSQRERAARFVVPTPQQKAPDDVPGPKLAGIQNNQ